MSGKENDVVRTTPTEYGPDFRKDLLQQYKLYVQMADNVSSRRTSANSYLLSVNAFLVTLYSIASTALSSNKGQLWLYAVPVAGVLICIAWLALIKSYKDLNSAKFKVVHELECYLPAAPYDREWDLADRGEGHAYLPLTHIEPYIPYVFAALYILLAAFAVISQ